MTSYDWPTIVTYATLLSGLVIQALQIKELKLRIQSHEMSNSNKRAVLVRPTDDEVKLYGKQPEGTNVDSSERIEKTATNTALALNLLVIGDGKSEQTSRTTGDPVKPVKEHLPKRPFWTLSHALAGAVIVSLVCFSLFEFKRTANAKQRIIELEARLQKAENERKEAESKTLLTMMKLPALDFVPKKRKQTGKVTLIGDSKLSTALNLAPSSSPFKFSGASELRLTTNRKKNLPSLGISMAGN